MLKYVLLIGCLIINPPLFSQKKNSATETTKQESSPKIELIPALEITNRLPDATNKINSINKSLITTELLNEGKVKLDTFLLEYKEFVKLHNLSKIKTLEQSRLQNKLYSWEKEKEKLNSIQQTFDDIKSELLEQKTSLLSIKTLWEKSLEAAKKDNLPGSARRMVNSFLKDVDKIDITINKKNEFVYKQLEIIANTIIALNDSIQEINNNLGSITETLLLKKEPSLFHKIFKEEKEELKEEMPENYTLNDLYTPIVNYTSDNLTLLIFHFVFFLLLFVLLNIVKKRIKREKYTNEETRLIHFSFEILSRPVITSFLIFLLSSNVLYYDAPPIFETLTYFLLLIPVMIILPIITIKQMDIYIYGLGFLYLLTLFLRLHIVNPLTEYLIILGTISAALIGIEKFLRKNIIYKVILKTISRTIVILLFYSFAALLIVSFFSIILGYYSLGVFLFDNTIWSIYRFFLFYAAFVIIAGFTELLIHSDYIQQINSIKKNSKDILSWISSFILVMTFFFLFKDIFSLFDIDKPIAESFISLWNFALPIGELNITIGNILTLFITIWVSGLISKIVSSVLEQDVLKKFKLKRGVPRTISILAKYTILTVGFLIAIAAAGMELSNFTIIMGALGVGIGFGLQDIINNFISGLILLFERPIQTGDTIQVGELWGKVKNIGIRSSIVRSFDGSEVIVPNGMLISREVTNWTLSDQKRRLDIEVGVEYGTDLKQVLGILIDCANKHKDVMDDPAPAAWFIGFGDSSINFKLLFWHPSFDGSLVVKSEVAIEIFDALKKANITIPFPQQDVYIKENTQTENKQKITKSIKEKEEDNKSKK